MAHKYSYLRLLGVIALLALLAPPYLAPLAAAATGDSENGKTIPAQVTVAAAQPTVSFDLYSDSGYSTPTNELVPQTPVYMKIDVSTDNLMEEVSVKVDMFADNDATAVGTPPSTTNPQNYVTFTISWDSNQNKWVLSADTGGSSTWSIQLDPNQNQPSPDATSGTFYVVIKPGKTAAEATPGESHTEYQDWDIIVTATVAGQASSQASKSGLTMYFYGEVDSSTTSIDFGTLQPRSRSSVQQVSATVIANGDFNLVTYSDATWKTSDNKYQMQLVTAEPGQDQFRINASLSYDSTNNKLNSPLTLGSSLDSAAVLASAVNGPTDESGLGYTIYYQLELGYGIHTGTYTGSVYVYAVDAG